MRFLIIILLIASGCTVYKYECYHLKPLPTKTEYWFDGINHHYTNPNGTGLSTNILGSTIKWSEINIDSTTFLTTGYHSPTCKCSTCVN